MSTVEDTGVEQARLLAAARGGDRAAFDALVAPHLRALHLHCYRMLGSIDAAEDALQEALLRAWRGLGGYEGRAPLPTGCTGSRPWPVCGRSNGASACPRWSPRSLTCSHIPTR